MSGFSDLVGSGAECGPGNGVNGLMKQFNKDHSLEQASTDRFGPGQASSSKQAFRQAFRQNGPIASPGVATAADFMAHANKSQGPGSFNFAEMHRELGGAPQADWSADFARHQAACPGAGSGHAELEHAFVRAGAGPGPLMGPQAGPMMQMHPMARQQANWAEQFHQPASQAPAAAATVAAPMRPDPMAMAFNEARMYSMMPGPGMMVPQMMAAQPMPQQWQHQQHQQHQQVGGAAEQTLLNASDPQDMLSTNDDLAETASQILESVCNSANPKFKNSEFFSFMHQLADRQATISGDQVVTNQKGKQAEPQALSATSGPTWATEFEKRAEELINRESAASVSEQTPHDGKIFSEEFARGLERNWAEEFEQTLSGPLNESSVSGHPQEMDVKLDQPSSQYIHSEAQDDWLEQFKDKIQPMLSEQDREWLDTQKEWEKLNGAEAAHRAVDPELNIYRFQADNYYAQLSPSDLKDAIQHMQQSPESASLGDTILALESAVTQTPQDAQVWLQLGLKQQENEQEQAAIAALRKAISLDANSLDAHLALAVSYTNEGYQMDAYDELHEWVSRHDRYKTLVPGSAPESMDSGDTRKAYVQSLYIKAARMTPGQDWDPDVQVALGVLFNISSEYDKAVDCFKAALSKRPDDYILWNRLGATEAHIGNNQEATAAYFRALELHPSFIRARYNLSLASTNMGQHREAAENCLIALSLQQRELQSMDEKGKAAHIDASRTAPARGMSSTIWNALQLSMYMLGEPQLAESCEKQDLDAFRAKFDF
ncbi:hypothetical protein GGH94_001639 [Coemansia aciculifera]|uniref:TPR-like protein n=1 Tax=Coemansia aciculifera TaxID=417176 RepID=A0A9W8M6R3_9FUNG|nr:hypothetical protein GGH94_001639 [Coemansia aciculifera]KAJ2874734.1 hypothetical protein GGH93_002185 [Coemansia aciculifera]